MNFIFIKVLVVLCVQLFANSWTVAHQVPLSIEFSRLEYWSGLPFPSPGDFAHPGIEPGSPELQADSLPSELPRKLFKKKKSKYYPYQRTLQDFKIGTILRVKGAMVTKLCQTIKDKLGLPQANPDTLLIPSHSGSHSSEVTAFNSIKHFSHVYLSISKE